MPKDMKLASLDELNQDLGLNQQYGRSKLSGILYACYLTRHLYTRHPKILANATHPSFVETGMSVDDIHKPFPVAGYRRRSQGSISIPLRRRSELARNEELGK